MNFVNILKLIHMFSENVLKEKVEISNEMVEKINASSEKDIEIFVEVNNENYTLTVNTNVSNIINSENKIGFLYNLKKEYQSGVRVFEYDGIIVCDLENKRITEFYFETEQFKSYLNKAINERLSLFDMVYEISIYNDGKIELIASEIIEDKNNFLDDPNNKVYKDFCFNYLKNNNLLIKNTLTRAIKFS